MKKWRQSTGLLMGINILVLGLFLFFWLRSEYRNEKSVLMQEAGLAVAERIMLIGGMNLDSLLLEFQQSMPDSIVLQQDGKRVIRHDIAGKTPPTSTHQWQIDDQNERDTFINLKFSDLDFPHSDSIRTSYSIIISDNEGGQTIDSMNITRTLRDDYLSDTEDISRQAIRNIRPQILFATLLFALSLLAIYLLQRLFRERQHTLESRNVLISNITHELKTPVATIGVALEAIQDFNFQADPQKTQSYLRTSRLELSRLSGLIDQILQFSKIDQGVVRYQMEPHSLRLLLTEAIETLRLLAEAKNADIQLSLDQEDWLIPADEQHLRGALINIIDNCLKYGPTNVQVRIGAQKTNGQITLRIADNGPGIPEAYRQRVFERFFRVPQGDTHNVKGSGLGLSYATEVIRAHQGSINLDTQEGSGTTVVIKLPLHND